MRDVGIVVVTYNSQREIGPCLDAALATGAEVVVVDNASQDGTVAEAGRRHVSVLANPRNRGFAAAVNQGFAVLNTPYVLLLNPDAVILGGLDQLRAAAAAAPAPPAGFDIESVAAAALRKQDEELSRTNPQLAAWVRIRQKLEGPDGDKYFAETLHNSPLPKLKGALIKADPPGKPSELTIGVIDPAQAEIVLKLTTELPNDAAAGAVVEFEGIVDSFVKSPFGLTVISDPSKISGWPAAPAAAQPAGKGDRQ